MTRLAEPIKGWVRGSWDDSEDDPNVYPALIVGYWNGWAEPVMDKATVKRMVADQPTGDGYDALSWDGDTLLYKWEGCEPDDEPERIEPSEAGEYNVGLGWCWMDCAEDGGDPPDDGITAPTEAMLDSFRFVCEQFVETWGHISSGGRTVNPDGSHTFPISIVTKPKGDDNMTHTCHVGTITIDREGNVTAP